jgi:hypothetical protein
VFLLVFALRFFALSRLAASPYFLPDFADMKFYSDWALRISHGHLTTGESFYGLPGYAYFLALIYSLFGFDPFLVGILQAAAEGATAAILFQIGVELFAGNPGSEWKGRWVGGLAAIAWALFEPAQAFSIILMPASWLVLAYWGCVLWMVKTRGQSASWWKPWLVFGLIIGAMSMMIATILFLLPLAMVAIAQRVRGGAAKALALATLLLGVFAGMSPCWLHNRLIAHEPVLLSAHSGLNFFIGNNEISNGYPKMPPGMRASQENMLRDSITLAQKATGRRLQHYEVSQYWSEKANDYISHHTSDWLRLMGRKFRNFWNAYQYDDLSLVTHFSQDWILLPGLRFGVVAALGLAGMLVAGVRYSPSRWVIAAVLLHMAALMSVFVTERYRLAAAPGLCVLSAILVIDLWESLVRKQWAPVLGMGGLAVAGAFVVSLPQLDRDLWWLDYYNTGVRATERGELDKAQRNLDKAYAYAPGNAETNFALGNLWLEKKEVYKAKYFYQMALEIDPSHAKAWNNLGVLALTEKRWALASKFFTNSLASEPEDAKTHFLLARTKAELNDLSAAKQEIEAALALRPEEKQFKAFQEELQKRGQSLAPQ